MMTFRVEIPGSIPAPSASPSVGPIAPVACNVANKYSACFQQHTRAHNCADEGNAYASYFHRSAFVSAAHRLALGGTNCANPDAVAYNVAYKYSACFQQHARAHNCADDGKAFDHPSCFHRPSFVRIRVCDKWFVAPSNLGFVVTDISDHSSNFIWVVMPRHLKQKSLKSNLRLCAKSRTLSADFL